MDRSVNKNSRKIVLLLTGLLIVSLCFSLLSEPAVAAKKKLKKPARVKISKVISKNEKIATVYWKKAKSAGYQLQLATNKTFKKGRKNYTIKKTKKNTTIKKLKTGKKYYFRIRAFNKSGKKKKYGKWSKIIACKVHSHKYKIIKKTESAKIYKCSCGRKQTKKIAVKKETPKVTGTLLVEPTLTTPEDTRSAKAGGSSFVRATGTNSRSFTYNYKIYRQGSTTVFKTYPKYQKYLASHGCSVCCLTTVLNAMVPELAAYTPDMVVKEIFPEVAGKDVFNANFAKTLKYQMPIGLKGVSQVLDRYGIKHKYVYDYCYEDGSVNEEDAVKEIRNHLKNGDPVIFTAQKCNGYQLFTTGVHSLIALGLDENGMAVVGDSCLGNANKWGSKNGLIKHNVKDNNLADPNLCSIENLVHYSFNSPTKDVSSKGFFYKGPEGNVGYILINNMED